MSAAATEVLIATGALVAIVVAACYLRGVIRIVLIVQAAHWALSYVARPTVLLLTHPQPHFGDNIPDPRLAEFGYDDGIAAVLRHVVFGLCLYAALVVCYAIWARNRPAGRPPTPYSTRDPHLVPTLWALYVVGTVGRLAAVATGGTGRAGELESPNPVINLVTLLATLGAVGLIVFLRPRHNRTTILVIGLVMLGELLWTMQVQSKTPVIGAALAVAVRFALTGWTRRKVLAVCALSALGLAAFGRLQALKATTYAASESALPDSAYPGPVRPFLSILRRFDLLEGATDAYYAGPGSWLSLDEVVVHMLHSLVPAQLLGTEKYRAGAAWAENVRGSSVDMTTVQVSLAEGNVNEGFVLGGYTGVAIAVTWTFVLVVLWARAMYSRSLVAVVLVLAVIEVPVAYERGMLGSVEMLGKYLQAAVLVALIYLAVGEYRRRTESRPAPTRLTAVGKARALR
ncbi:hypothetical protein FEK35_19315 [Nocardia cyriacigeorgica]|uniref:O-antigen polysaccharide polymerase Wzy n=1 Tax=Nocardia cyriacigeorgica TaxID=135487 RepID=A0A5R8PAU0_9NOCA|nr:hypothetical protein [Nocardia cyriacigeorgica]TLG05316.1 hypothetical protein FEK35_19315 [Nocardia cyriacigeorgica]